MKLKNAGHYVCSMVLAAAMMPLATAQTAQPALAKEAGTLCEKFAGLSKVMAGKYEWKPAAGVRSAGDVLNLIVMENGMLAATLSGAAMGGRPAPITDAAKMEEALRGSYAKLQKVIEGLSEADLKSTVKLFGMEMTKEGAIRFLFGDQHEHLGQSIAYARMNGVVPPWSK